MANNDFRRFVIEKKLTSSDITTSDVNIAQFDWNGAIIEDIIIRTDSTGLAWGTNFQLKADWILFFVTATSWLGASAIMDMNWASVTGIQAILETGSKNITVSNTVAVWTGAWVATIEIVFRKLDSNTNWFAI